MKDLTIDWHRFIGHLDLWASLRPETRDAYLQLKPNKGLPGELFNDKDAQKLLDAGLMTASADGRSMEIPSTSQFFADAIWTMRYPRLSARSIKSDLVRYINAHLSSQEQEHLLSDTRIHTYYVDSELAKTVIGEEWFGQLRTLTSAKAALKWEQKHLPVAARHAKNAGEASSQDGTPCFADADLFDATQRLVAAALTWPQPVKLARLHEHVRDVEPELLHRAIMPAVRYLFLLVWLDSDDQPVIGIWPPLAHLLHRGEPAPPEPVEPEQTSHAAMVVEDMTSLLVVATAEPLRVLATGDGLYVRDMQRLSETIGPLPAWLYGDSRAHDAEDADDWDDDSSSELPSGVAARIHDALYLSLQHDLLASQNSKRGQHLLQVTDKGRAWLSDDLHGRIATVLQPWRDSQPLADSHKQHMVERLIYIRDSSWLIGICRTDRCTPWTTPPLGWHGGAAARKIDWKAAFADLLADADGRFVALEDLLAYHVQVNNPLMGRRLKGTYGRKTRPAALGIHIYDSGAYAQLHLENLWLDMVARYFAEVLLPLGAVEYGMCGRRIAVRLHSIGRYMLGLDDDFTFSAQPEGGVIVQPNFEITFLGPAPSTEARLGRIAQRIGSGVGTLFRLTRASIVAAAAAGITVDQAIADLTETSSKAVPDNVLREVRGWFNATRQVRMRHTVLLEAPDEQTAMQILAAAGKNNVRQLSPTLVEVLALKNHKTLATKLKKAGIFLK